MPLCVKGSLNTSADFVVGAKRSGTRVKTVRVSPGAEAPRAEVTARL